MWVPVTLRLRMRVTQILCQKSHGFNFSSISFSTFKNCWRPFKHDMIVASRLTNFYIPHSQMFHTSEHLRHGEYEWKDPESEADVVQIKVYNKEGKESTVRGKIGDNLLYLCKRFDVDMEGACEASLACTTCHVYVDHEFLDLIPLATETEEDLLDQAPFLRDNSRLGCQIILTKEYDGMVLRLPAATKNFYVDGHKPTHH